MKKNKLSSTIESLEADEERLDAMLAEDIADEEEQSLAEQDAEEDSEETALSLLLAEGIEKAPTQPNEEEKDMFIFYGFQGELANKFSAVRMLPSILKSVIDVVNLSGYLPAPLKVIEDKKEMQSLADALDERLQSIPFDEATAIIRSTPNKPKEQPMVAYEFAEEDEFDENCTAECTPGEHKCNRDKSAKIILKNVGRDKVNETIVVKLWRVKSEEDLAQLALDEVTKYLQSSEVELVPDQEKGNGFWKVVVGVGYHVGDVEIQL